MSPGIRPTIPTADVGQVEYKVGEVNGLDVDEDAADNDSQSEGSIAEEDIYSPTEKAQSDGELFGDKSEAEDAEEKLKEKLLIGAKEEKKGKEKKRPGDDDGDGRGVHMGTILNGEELWSKDFKPELSKQIIASQMKCFEIVDRD